jgi:hypothetical protein
MYVQVYMQSVWYQEWYWYWYRYQQVPTRIRHQQLPA